MGEFASFLGGVVNLRTAGLVLGLVLVVVLAGFLVARGGKRRREKPGQHMAFLCPGRTAAECRSLLGRPGEQDIFAYRLEQTPDGALLQLESHRPTGQPLATVFLLQFTGEEPAHLTLRFVREAFGMREPVVPQSLMAEFLAAKLGAVPAEVD